MMSPRVIDHPRGKINTCPAAGGLQYPRPCSRILAGHSHMNKIGKYLRFLVAMDD
jgi:hypothetical protein